MIKLYKLYRKNSKLINNENIEGLYSIKEIDGGIEFIIDLKGYVNKKYDIKLMYSDWAGKGVLLSIRESYTRLEMKTIEIFNKIADGTIDNNHHVIYPDANLIRIIFNKDCSEIIVLNIQDFLEESKDTLEKYSLELLDRDKKSGTEYLCEKSSYLKSIIEKRKIKEDIIIKNDIYNSISYLEAQLDAVTKLLLAILKKYNIDLSDTELANAMFAVSKANEYSVLNIKSIDKVLEEFENKKQMRELQTKYYDEKSKLEESTNSK